MADFHRILFGRDGRLSRGAYVQLCLLPLAVLALVTGGIYATEGLSGVIGSPPLLIAWMAALLPFDALNIKRYRDIGMSGAIYRLLRPLAVIIPLFSFWGWAYWPATAGTDALAFMAALDAQAHPTAVYAAMGFWAALLLANFVFLAIRPGQDGPNLFGPDPRNPSATAPAGGGADAAIAAAAARLKAEAASAAPGVAQAAVKPMTSRGPAPAAGFGRKKR